MSSIVESTEKFFDGAAAQISGLLDPNYNHDDPEEKAADAARQRIRDSHRFNSFAGQRSGNAIKWHIDGHDYMWAVSEMIDSAKEFIFILDWWLTPELYLRRPPAYFPEWRLDRLLQKKARQGVKIHVIVYQEIKETSSPDSEHTKDTLDELHKLHPNITCMRHPNHFGAKDATEYWSHHEKVVLVDNKYAAIGGFDLCFGRWDTHTHPLADVHPTNMFNTLFPGQDYNNTRIMDFSEVSNYVSNTLSIRDYARMPWHDVHHPHLQQWAKVGQRYSQSWHGPNAEVQNVPSRTNEPGTCKVQVVRSVTDWSHGVLTEKSIQNAYIQLINEANHYIYIGIISATMSGDVVTNTIAKALLERIVRAAKEGKKFKVVVVIPEVPGFSGDIKDVRAIKTIMGAQYRTINRGGHSIYDGIRDAGIRNASKYEPTDYIRFYHLRTYDRINAPKGIIEMVEKNSGVTFPEAQVSLARQWAAGDTITVQKEVVLGVPQKEDVFWFGKDDEKVNDEKQKPATITAPIPEDEQAAVQVLQAFQNGSYGLQGNQAISDSVAQHRLSTNSSLLDEPWLGSEQEELDSYVSELIYIHSKVMIVDDRRVIMGSANFNDRSQKGDGDSEIALVVEDDDLIESYMDGQPYSASRFAATIRRQLYKEHLGLIPPQDCDDPQSEVTNAMRPSPIPNDDTTGSREDQLVADPLSDATDSLWTTTARRNREIYAEIFHPVPTDLIPNWEAYKDYQSKSKGETNHVVEGIPLGRVKDRLSEVKGALVEMPMDFLTEEDGLVSGIKWTELDFVLPIYI
ncbi:phospholipase D/nuclease [Phlegmacium glaucopus]|nr:phospholipase D/nuclease [Phlegmacium glaucopus]